jgi:8-hydroxy-5-deazaflavin:NADPH oxidoreductase
MKFAILGTGMVGTTIASKLTALGHQVTLGSRTANNEKAVAWQKSAGKNASIGTFAEAAAFGEWVFNCTKGDGSLDALRAAGKQNLAGKVLVDVSNPLDFSKGFPPSLTVCNTDSLAEQIQREVPEAKVVKALNTINAYLMVDPARIQGGAHDVFICGNDAGAKSQVTQLLREGFGWKTVHDLGDLTAARGTEAWLLLWTRLYGAFQTADFGVRIVR